MSVQRLKRVLVGRPIPTSLDQHERLSRVTGLAVFASDALSSVAYAEYLDHLQRQAPEQFITIILPEFIPARWWQHLLHNQTALLIKGALLFRKGIVVTNVPYHLA